MSVTGIGIALCSLVNDDYSGAFLSVNAPALNNLDIKRHLAKAYLAQGKSIRAEKYLKQILAADTENEEALNLLKQCV